MTESAQLVRNYEADADRRMASICRLMALLMAVVILLNLLHVFRISSALYPTLLVAIAVMFLPTLFYNVLKLDTPAVRYLVLTLVVLMAGLLYAVLSYHVIIMLVFPVVVSCLYCDRNSVLYTTCLSLPVMVVCHLIAYRLQIVPDEPLVTLRGVLVYGVLPRSIQLVAFSIICMSVTGKLQRLIQSLVKKNDDLLMDQQSLVYALAELVEGRSKETGQHVKRVGAYTEILCQGLGLSFSECWKVSVASMLHDVGKLNVPREVLQKPGKLTDEEFGQIRQHVDMGYDLLCNSPGEIMQISARIAQQHHERYDGKGYQQGLSGEEIDLYARCVSVADVFDALVSRRCYKPAWTPEEARTEILAQSGKQFDPTVVQVFDQNFDKFLAVLDQFPDE